MVLHLRNIHFKSACIDENIYKMSFFFWQLSTQFLLKSVKKVVINQLIKDKRDSLTKVTRLV